MIKLYEITATSNKGEITFWVRGNDFADAVLNGLAFDAYGTEVYAIQNVRIQNDTDKVLSW